MGVECKHEYETRYKHIATVIDDLLVNPQLHKHHKNSRVRCCRS